MPPRPLPVALALALAPLLARSLAARPLPFSNLQAGPSPTVEMPPALPQATTTLRGRVLDPAGAAIAGAAPRHPAIDHGGDARADSGPADDQPGRCRALRPRPHRASGREQSRSADHPRQ